MVTEDQARGLASEWLGVAPAAVGVHEFEHGWVVWEITQEEDDVLSMLVGSAKGVVARDDGTVTSWPSMPADTVAQRFTDWTRSRGRFGDEAEEGLYAAGWYPGRSVGDHAHEWLSNLVQETVERGAELNVHERAGAFADEFGRLMLVRQLDEKGKRLLRLYPLAFESLPVRNWRPSAAAASTVRDAGVEGELCPVGVYQRDDALEEILLDEHGAVYAVGRAVRRLGESEDEALSAFLLSEEWAELDDAPEPTAPKRATAKKAAAKKSTAARKSTAERKPATTKTKPTSKESAP